MHPENRIREVIDSLSAVSVDVEHKASEMSAVPLVLRYLCSKLELAIDEIERQHSVVNTAGDHYAPGQVSTVPQDDH